MVVVEVVDGSTALGENNNYIAALLLVESGRIASDGLEAPARHHLGCECAGVSSSSSCPLAKLPMALILAGAHGSRLSLGLCFGYTAITVQTKYDIVSIRGRIAFLLQNGSRD
jgi:hypothetical protein